MRCEQVMQKVVVIGHPHDSARQAASVMRDQNIGFLPICDGGGHVLGAITDRDLAIRVCADGVDAEAVTLDQIMTREVVACSPEAELTDAERLMAEHGKSRVLITDDDEHLLGVISLADIAWGDSNKHVAHTLRKVVVREIR